MQPLSEHDKLMLVWTVLGEAANEPDKGQRGVANVILNRLNAGRFGKSVSDVVTAPNQFEPWNTAAGRSHMMAYAPESQAFTRALHNVDDTLNGAPDPTGGATHFYAPVAQAMLGRQPPQWAAGKRPSAVIGGHQFYSLGNSAPLSKPVQTVDVRDLGASFQPQTFSDAPPQPPGLLQIPGM